MTSDDKLLETRLVRMRGQVQGIGYREACVRRALIDEFLDAHRNGPTYAHPG